MYAPNYNRFTSEIQDRQGRFRTLVNIRHSMTKAVWNRKRGEFLCRTPRDWLLLAMTYAGLYSVLAVTFAASSAILFFVVYSDDQPHLTGQQSMLAMSPALGIRPNVDDLTIFMRMVVGHEEISEPFYQNIAAYVEQYEDYYTHVGDEADAGCDIRRGTRQISDPTKVCRFPLDALGGCVKETMFGYGSMAPCILVKMNRIFGWIPEAFEAPDNHDTGGNSTDNNGPGDNGGGPFVGNRDPLVECRGRSELDREFMGPLRYFPNKTIGGRTYGYFSHLFFPYLIQEGYRSPLVMVQFNDMAGNRAVMIECRLLGVKNVFYDAQTRSGSVTFEMMWD